MLAHDLYTTMASFRNTMAKGSTRQIIYPVLMILYANQLSLPKCKIMLLFCHIAGMGSGDFVKYLINYKQNLFFVSYAKNAKIIITSFSYASMAGQYYRHRSQEMRGGEGSGVSPIFDQEWQHVIIPTPPLCIYDFCQLILKKKCLFSSNFTQIIKFEPNYDRLKLVQ